MTRTSNTQLNVLHVINDLDEDGGAQRVVRDLAVTMGGVRSSILTLRPVPGSVLAELSGHIAQHVSLMPLGFSQLRRALALVRSSDILHVHLFPCLYLASILPKPKIFTEHNTWNRRRAKKRHRFLERLVYRRYDRVVCISEAAQAALARWLRFGQLRMLVIDNGVRLGRFEPHLRTEPHASPRLAMIASLTAQKDQDTVIRAIARIPSARLTLVGDGPRREHLVTLASDLGVTDRVDFRGQIPGEDIPHVLRQVDLLVQSSHWEGFGLTVVEAMASGVPVLATGVPGLREVIGNEAMLFEVGDTDSLVIKLKALLADRKVYASCSQAGLERAHLYTAERAASNYRRCYREVLRSRNSNTE